MSDIKMKYLPEKNPDAREVPGAPLADIPVKRWERMPAHVQRDVAACGFYAPVTPPAVKKNKTAKKKPVAMKKDGE